MECPENTPKSVYKVMSSCWAASTSSRPSFRTLFRDLNTIEGELTLIQKHLKGLGVEVAKNVILGGVKSVTLHDTEKVRRPFTLTLD